jgi:Tfp pilus assembly protein PilF
MISAGQCALELKQMDRARVYFQRALKQPQTTNAARQWLDYLQVLAEIEVSS